MTAAPTPISDTDRQFLLTNMRSLIADGMLVCGPRTTAELVVEMDARLRAAEAECQRIANLLRRYVGHIIDREGINYIDRDSLDGEYPWSAEDRAAILAILAASPASTREGA